LLKIFLIRAGYRIGEGTGAFRYGAGIKFNMFQLDYSFNSYGDLGNVNRLGIKIMIK